MGERVREPTGLKDTELNRKVLREQLNLVIAEIENGIFTFSKRFPHSSKKAHFSRLEGNRAEKTPNEILFGEYVKRWWSAMKPGMSDSKIRDYTNILDAHALPYFGDMPFSALSSVEMKKFIAHLKAKENRKGEPLNEKGNARLRHCWSQSWTQWGKSTLPL